MLPQANYRFQLQRDCPMVPFKKISTTLSVAAAVLLEACSSSSTDSGPAPVPNTTAPQLLATWETDCIISQSSGSTTTVTQASGGSGGSISGGAAYINRVVFKQDGRVEFSTEYYATSNCNANTLSSFNRYNAVYFVGGPGIANDGSPVTEIDYSDSNSSTYSIFQIINSNELYLGDATTSSPGNDGSSEASRFDGLVGIDSRMLKQ